MKKIIFLIAFLFYSSTIVFAQDWETWEDKIPVSGGVRVGLMLDKEIKTIKNTKYTYYVRIPDTIRDTICVEFSSKDGRYSAKRLEKINSKQYVGHSYYSFELPTKFKSELANYKTDEVVILASFNSNCQENPEFYLVSVWGVPRKEKAPYKKYTDSIFINLLDSLPIAIYVNSQIPTILEDKYGNTTPCNGVSTPAVAFNKKCVIGRISFNATDTLIVKQRIRRLGKLKINNYIIKLIK